MHEIIIIRIQWVYLYYRRVVSTRNRSVDGGYDIRTILQGGEQLLLEYLSPGRVEFTLLLLSLPIPGKKVEGQTFRLQLARRTVNRAFKKTSPPDFYRKNITNSITFTFHCFVPTTYLKQSIESVLFDNTQRNSSTDPNLKDREKV